MIIQRISEFIDPGEVLTLTVTFDPADFEKVQFEEIDLGNMVAQTMGYSFDRRH